MTFVEFCCDGEQINVESAGFFRKMAEIMDSLCNSRKQPPGGVLEKSRNTANAHAKEIILVKMPIIIQLFVK